MKNKNGTAVVTIAQTTEKHCSQERVCKLVKEAVDLLGGMVKFVGQGDTVLIKPNQTVFYSAEEGCTTDLLVVGALTRSGFSILNEKSAPVGAAFKRLLIKAKFK